LIEFSKVQNVESEAFREAVNIYTEAIPKAEQQKVSVIKRRVKTGKEHLIVGRKDGKVVCMALIYLLQDADFMLIDYLAVKKQYLQQGIGSNLIRYIKNTYGTEGKWLIIEAEDPKHGEDRRTKACRIAFYKKNGAKELKGVPYQLPPIQGNAPIPMILLALNMSQETKIDGVTVKKLISQIYEQLYGRDNSDALLNMIINLVPRTVFLEIDK